MNYNLMDMEKMMEVLMASIPTTPEKATGKVGQFCRSLSREKAVYLTLQPFEGAVAENCHLNTAEAVRRFGGRVVYGWTVWVSRSCAEAIFHSVWETPEGELKDITPKADGEGEILFVPDPKRSRDLEEGWSYSNRFHAFRKGKTTFVYGGVEAPERYRIAKKFLNPIREAHGLEPLQDGREVEGRAAVPA
ncbi:hypothetical protein F1188_00835 [Roseospira marina]|uniref:Uncharacterized protein n=1 Tax=Roseospira marina TaxID=140057 RepID=A0A5M6IGI9_9PROT|nr:hypothetical protein [Roseospira marina]KAA5607344.1 hypothetical protein F1188_00835 [Roseospira marina]MBB4312492.1 hypothetical protein [Roseospira marina]MBB5085492.1 hypothetical protein [Roseospira marina]